MEEHEKMLIYEFVSNKSLDYFLFGNFFTLFFYLLFLKLNVNFYLTNEEMGKMWKESVSENTYYVPTILFVFP